MCRRKLNFLGKLGGKTCRHCMPMVSLLLFFDTLTLCLRTTAWWLYFRTCKGNLFFFSYAYIINIWWTRGQCTATYTVSCSTDIFVKVTQDFSIPVLYLSLSYLKSGINVRDIQVNPIFGLTFLIDPLHTNTAGNAVLRSVSMWRYIVRVFVSGDTIESRWVRPCRMNSFGIRSARNLCCH